MSVILVEAEKGSLLTSLTSASRGNVKQLSPDSNPFKVDLFDPPLETFPAATGKVSLAF